MTRTPEEVRRLIDEAEKEFIDKGLIIEAGFAGFCKLSVHPKTSAETVGHIRTAFFCGAHHLFGTLMNVLEQGDDATDEDLRRMDLIYQELQKFKKDFVAENHLGETLQ